MKRKQQRKAKKNNQKKTRKTNEQRKRNVFRFSKMIKGKELKETQQKYFGTFVFSKNVNKSVKRSKDKIFSKFQQRGNKIHFQRKSKTNEEISLLFSQRTSKEQKHNDIFWGF